MSAIYRIELFRGQNRQWYWRIRARNGRKPPSDRRLTPAEQEWHAAWRGQVATVYSIDDALRVVFGKEPA